MTNFHGRRFSTFIVMRSGTDSRLAEMTLGGGSGMATIGSTSAHECSQARHPLRTYMECSPCGEMRRQARHTLCPWKKVSQMVLFGTGAGASAATVAPVAIASGAAGGGDAARDGDGPAVSVSSSDRHPQNLLVMRSVSSSDRHPQRLLVMRSFHGPSRATTPMTAPSCHALIPWSVSGNDAHDGAAVAGAGAVVGASPPPTNRNNAPRPPRAASCAFVLVSCTACPMPETP